MLYDAETATTPGQNLTADICIIGSGAAGISMAHKFIGSTKKSLSSKAVVSTNANLTPPKDWLLFGRRNFPPTSITDTRILQCSRSAPACSRTGMPMTS